VLLQLRPATVCFVVAYLVVAFLVTVYLVVAFLVTVYLVVAFLVTVCLVVAFLVTVYLVLEFLYLLLLGPVIGILFPAGVVSEILSFAIDQMSRGQPPLHQENAISLISLGISAIVHSKLGIDSIVLPWTGRVETAGLAIVTAMGEMAMIYLADVIVDP
jgi:hypothetical protein